MFPSSGDGRKTVTLLGTLERANLNRCVSSLREETNPVSETLFSNCLEFRTRTVDLVRPSVYGSTFQF
jgi:hypothetical protein